ncbi:PIN domain-containing protein [Roseburia sp.]|uniref:PIN domain-containing protein n=1 Tax=Roseburia sp. TaxID=2049040 RepID=UPI00352100AB
MKRIYLVDSENVGDIWVPLLVASQPDEEVIVFYTQKSPHMNYENVRLLKETEKEAEFIKCFEGSNALDFQLVTQLGYMLCENQENCYVIVSNDTGFDAAVRYWKQRNMPVQRISGKELSRRLQQKTKTAELLENSTEAATGQTAEFLKHKTEAATGQTAEFLKHETEAATEQTAESMKNETVTAEEQVQTEKYAESEEMSEPEEIQMEMPDEIMRPDETADGNQQDEELSDADPEKNIMVKTPEISKEQDEVIRSLLTCISKDRLADFHNALVLFFGEEIGKELYQEAKNSSAYAICRENQNAISEEEKFDVYCQTVFAYSDPKLDCPEDFSSFLYKANAKRKNLNSLRAALQGHYGKDKGMKYYSLFKSHIKIMNRM